MIDVVLLMWGGACLMSDVVLLMWGGACLLLLVETYLSCYLIVL